MNKTTSHLGSQLGRDSHEKVSEDGGRLDSVLGNTNRDILLKAVIQKVDFGAKRMDDINSKLRELLERH